MARKRRETSTERASARTTGAAAPSQGTLADRLRVERDDAIAKLRDLGLTPHRDGEAPREVGLPVLDEGDAAQATERMDMSLAARQRLAERINRLTAALARIHEGTHGTCELCGEAIEPARLAAMPEASTCLACQEKAERTGTTAA
jgi:DnaK suppressor protein